MMTPAMEAVETIDALDDDAFRKRVAEVLSRELSLSGYLRFLRLCVPKSGNYTEDRHQWLDGVSLDEFVADMKNREASH
jgi:hypothetical protein